MSDVYTPSDVSGLISAPNPVFGAAGSLLGGGGLSAGVFSGIDGAISDIAGGVGSLASAKLDQQAAAIAGQNAAIESQEAVPLREFMENEKINAVYGQQQAQLGAAGVSGGGSGIYLARQTLAEGARAKAAIGIQGAIETNQFKQEQTAYEAQASAAQAGGAGGILSGIMKGIGVAAQLAAFI